MTEQCDRQERRFAAHGRKKFTDQEANDLLTGSLDARAQPVTRLPCAFQDWRSPRQPEFSQDGETDYRLFNAAREALKEGDYMDPPRRGLRTTA